MDGLSKSISSKAPEVEKALNKVTAASGKVIVEQEKLNALKEKGNATDSQMIAQSERLRKAHSDEAAAINAVNRALDDHSNKTRKLTDDISGATARIGDLGGALRGLGAVGALGSLPAVATAITSVAGALQQLSGAALAGPGIFAGIAASAGTAALGMNGMKDAFTASIKAMDGTKASVEAANKALAELSPNAADAVKGVVGLKGTFTELRDISSTNIFEGFSGNLRNLVSADLPVLTRGIDGISKGLGQNLAQTMASLGSSSSQGFLDRILGNTGDAQSKLTAAIDPIVHAVGVLTAAGSDTLPRLAEAIGSVADRFNTFITNADNGGNLAKWMDQGITGFTQLGNTALNIGKTFTALTEAAGGGTGLLGTLESATDKLQTFLNSTQGQDQLRQYFTQGRDMLSQLKDIAVSAGPVLGGMFQAASSAAQMWLPVIKQILDTINSIPGGAEAVVNAFIAWQAIKGISSVATGLTGIANILKFALPAAAVQGAGGITAALAGISAPAWLGGLLAGGAVAAVGVGSHQAADAGHKPILEGRFPERARDVDSRGRGDGDSGYTGGGGSFANPAPSMSRGALDRQHENVDNIPLTPPAAPGLSLYSAPVITDPGSGGGGVATPYIDPSKFAVGNPLAGMPAPAAGVDPQALYEADSRALTAANNLAQGKLALAVLEAKGTATQQEMLTAKNNVAEQERALYDAQFKDLEVRQGKMAKASSDLQSIFAPLDQDFGISGGIPGIVKNLVTFLGNTALAGAIASSPTLQAAALDMMNPQTGATSPTIGGGGSSPGGIGVGGGYPGDAALLANVPAGRYTQEQRGDLTQGLADCSSAVEDLVNLMDGRPTAGASMATGNAAEWLTQRGFLPGSMPGAFNVGFNSGHMQATLPGGTPFNWGSNSSAARGGVGGTGADDPSFTSHYYRPAGASPSALGPAALGMPAAAAPPGLSGLPLPLPVTIVSGGIGGPVGVPAPGVPGAPTPGAPAPGMPPAPGTPVPGGVGGPPGDPFSSANNPALNNPAAPAGPMSWGGPPIPAGIHGGGGQGPIFGVNPRGPGIGASGGAGLAGVAPPGVGEAAGAGFNAGGVTPQGSSGGGGIGITPGGSIDAALTGAASMFPGGGAAAQIAIKLASRAIQYGGQVAGIGAAGLMETLLPSGSALGNFGNSWFGKLAGGLAGAKPAKPNAAAGKGAEPPKQGGPQGQGGPVDNSTTNNINMAQPRDTEDRAGADLVNHLSAMNSTPTPISPRG